MSEDKTLDQLESEVGCFLSMPKEKYEQFLAKKKAARDRARQKKI